eukprot:643386-Prymnesium_polylepis.1
MLRLLTAPPNPPSPPSAEELRTNVCTARPLFGLGAPEPVGLELWQVGGCLLYTSDAADDM